MITDEQYNETLEAQHKATISREARIALRTIAQQLATETSENIERQRRLDNCAKTIAIYGEETDRLNGVVRRLQERIKKFSEENYECFQTITHLGKENSALAKRVGILYDEKNFSAQEATIEKLRQTIESLRTTIAIYEARASAEFSKTSCAGESSKKYHSTRETKIALLDKTKYRMLAQGEILRAGDELLPFDADWTPILTNQIGIALSNPMCYIRRKVFKCGCCPECKVYAEIA